MFEKLKKFFKWLFNEPNSIIIATPAGDEPPTPQPEIRKGLVTGSSVGYERKKIKQSRIREQNLKRQKTTMGAKLNPKFFKPRSGHEKRNFDIRKTTEEDD